MLNLAVNARDVMPAGGRLTIETKNIVIDNTYSAAHGDVPHGQYVVIAVADTGTGMPADVIAKAFDPFFTTKEVGKGTGLGLSQVYGYVKRTGGHVNIVSEAAQRTTICIYLPRSANQTIEDGSSARTGGGRGAATETVLVVEDDDDVRTYTVESLRELGYRVLEAYDGRAALRLLDRQEVPIKLLFTEVIMPAMLGRELKDAALERQPGLKVLFTTGYARSAMVHGGRLDAGVVRQGLARLRAAGSGYDAVLLDADFDTLNLERIIEDFRIVRPGLPVVITTRTGTAKLKLRFNSDRCVGILPTPFDGKMLRDRLKTLQIHCAA